MDDGCSKRFDIETIHFRPRSPSDGGQTSAGFASRHEDNQSRYPSYNSSAHYSPSPRHAASEDPLDGYLTSASGPFLHRQEFLSGDIDEDPVWSD